MSILCHNHIMLSESTNFPPVLLWAVPFFLITLVIEFFIAQRRVGAKSHTLKDSIASLMMGTGNLVTDLTFGFISLAILFWAWDFRLIDLGLTWPVIFLALIVQDFVYYWKHRVSHRVRWFWAAHVVHHSSEHYNLTTALRQPWISHFTGYSLMSIPLVLVGFHPLLIGFVAALNLLYQYWIHTEIIKRMPNWFEAVFNTPSHHRVHHSVHPRHLDANYAGIFIIWDKMFGSFVSERPDEEMNYGVVSPIKTYNPFKIAFVEWINIFKDMLNPNSSAKLWERLKYALAPPGYSHDGSRQTSEDIKRQYLKENPTAAGSNGLPKRLVSLTETRK